MNESDNTAADSTGADNAESGSAGSSDSTGSKEQEAGATEQQTSAKKSSGENVKEVVPETASTYTVKDYTDDDSEPVEISLRTLMKAGAHFGHQTQRWNPKMAKYIYGARSGIHVINLDLTLKLWEKARQQIVDTVARGGSILFVGTKLQAREVIEKQAQRCGAFFVTTRWLGGTLSNFQTIKNSISRMDKIEKFMRDADDESSDVKIGKKERLSLQRELVKLESNLGGIRYMKRPPDLIFIIDIRKESIAVAEGRKLNIPLVALVDTNVDPGHIDHPLPANDDSNKTIELFTTAVADAVIEGRRVCESRLARMEGNVGSNGKSAGDKEGDSPAVVADAGAAEESAAAQ